MPKYRCISTNQVKPAAPFLTGRPSASEQHPVHGEDQPENMFPQALNTQHQLYPSSRSSLLSSYSSRRFLQLWALSPSGLARKTRSPRNQRLFGTCRSWPSSSKAGSLKTPVVPLSSRLPRSVPRRQSPAALVERPKSCDFQAVTGMTWTPRASDLCLSCPSSGWRGPGAAGQGKHSSTRNLQAWVQLHFETLTKCFHYIPFVVLLFYLIFKQIFHFSSEKEQPSLPLPPTNCKFCL